MAFARAARRVPSMVVMLALTMLALGTAGCGTVERWFGDDEPKDVEVESITTVTFGGCLRAFGSNVYDMDATANGSDVLYISSQRPPNLPEGAAWGRDDRALYIRSTGDNGAQRFNYIARSWELEDASTGIAAYSTPRPGQTGVEGYSPSEVMREVQISDAGERLLIGVSRDSEQSIARLYHGAVPADVLNEKLSPAEEGGLSPVPVNSTRYSEPVRQWLLSPDGSKVAAEVGSMGELRVYDFDDDQVELFLLGEENEIVKDTGLPIAYVTDQDDEQILDAEGQPQPIGIDPDHRPAVLVDGAKMAWSSDGSRLALARSQGVGSAVIDVLDVDAGEMQRVRRFDATDLVDSDDGRSYRVTWSMPQIAWSADDASLYVMVTPLGGPELFYDTQFRELDLETGRDVNDRYQEIRRPNNWRTEPANLINIGGDERFAFTWEDHLYRGDAPGGAASELGSPVQLTSFPDGVRVLYEDPVYTSGADALLFRVQDRNTLRVGERTSASGDCPADAAPVEGEDSVQ